MMRLKSPYRVTAQTMGPPKYERLASDVIDVEENQAGGADRLVIEQSSSTRPGEIPTIAMPRQEAEPSLTSLALVLHRI